MRISLEPGARLPAIRVPRSDGVSFCVVRQLPGGQWTGTCPDFEYRHRPCKHINKVRDRLRELKVA